MEKQQTKISLKVIEKFFELLDYMIGSLMPQYPNELDFKEGEYLLKYIKERLSEVLERYENANKLPLMNIVFYGDNMGGVDIYFRASPEPEFLNNFYLREAASLLKDACAEWERLYLKERPEIKVAGVEYDMIRKYIKGKKPKGGEGEQV